MLLVWDSEVTRHADGAVTLTPRKPLSRMSPKQAASLLGCTTWTVTRLYREGILSGWKPGSIAKRKDGRASNACIVLDAGSVLAYKEKSRSQGVF